MSNDDALVPQQPALDAEVEAGFIIVVRKPTQTAGGGDAMAGNDERKPVRAASLADRARRRAYQLGDFAIGQHIAARYVSDDFPDLVLKGGADLDQR